MGRVTKAQKQKQDEFRLEDINAIFSIIDDFNRDDETKIREVIEIIEAGFDYFYNNKREYIRYYVLFILDRLAHRILLGRLQGSKEESESFIKCLRRIFCSLLQTIMANLEPNTLVPEVSEIICTVLETRVDLQLLQLILYPKDQAENFLSLILDQNVLIQNENGKENADPKMNIAKNLKFIFYKIRSTIIKRYNEGQISFEEAVKEILQDVITGDYNKQSTIHIVYPQVSINNVKMKDVQYVSYNTTFSMSINTKDLLLDELNKILHNYYNSNNFSLENTQNTEVALYKKINDKMQEFIQKDASSREEVFGIQENFSSLLIKLLVTFENKNKELYAYDFKSIVRMQEYPLYKHGSEMLKLKKISCQLRQYVSTFSQKSTIWGLKRNRYFFIGKNKKAQFFSRIADFLEKNREEIHDLAKVYNLIKFGAYKKRNPIGPGDPHTKGEFESMVREEQIDFVNNYLVNLRDCKRLYEIEEEEDFNEQMKIFFGFLASDKDLNENNSRILGKKAG